MDKIKFAKVKDGAVIPSKREEDAGYDIYACFDEEYMIIEPHETKLIPTGIASAFDDKYVMILKERGSTGTKGIAQRCGVIDSGFRNEWVVPITNTSDTLLIIADEDKFDYYGFSLREKTVFNDGFQKVYNCGNSIVYPKSKAICQALLLPVPKVKVKEVTYDELIKIKSERGNGMLGSSGK